MNKREFLMLAQDYGKVSTDVSGWWMSEKLDGQRAFWDGGISRGLDAREVPWANVAKDARLLERPVATGLWSRYGKVIHAPDWWLDGLPVGINLDMELWGGRGSFQEMRSTVGSHTPGPGWKTIRGYALDAPGWHAVLSDGEINNANWKTILHRGMLEWVERRSQLGVRTQEGLTLTFPMFMGFGQPNECFERLKLIHQACRWSNAMWQPHDQVKLPDNVQDAKTAIDDMLHLVTEGGGEGLVLRSATGGWVCKRVNWVLKVKKLSDAEGVVVGYTWGRETALGSKLLGMMGALVLDFRGKRLELSGFTNDERQMVVNPDKPADMAALRVNGLPEESIPLEGKEVTLRWHNPRFTRGSKVTFTYRELTNDGIPKEARFLRRRTDE